MLMMIPRTMNSTVHSRIIQPHGRLLQQPLSAFETPMHDMNGTTSATPSHTSSSNRQNKLLALAAPVGQILVMVSALAWMFIRPTAAMGLAIGTLLMLLGRFAGPTSDIAQIRRAHHSLTTRRLYSQRLLGLFFLVLAAIAINAPLPTFLWGYYLRPSTWLLPFIIHAIFEVFTTLRLLHEENK